MIKKNKKGGKFMKQIKKPEQIINRILSLLLALVLTLSVAVPASAADTENSLTNLAPGKTVTVSGTSDGDMNNVNDGSTATKWDSNFIEKGINNVGQTSWLCIDLGGTFEISQVVVSYFNKIYPTSYILQISDDETEWTDVKSLTNDDNGATYPVDTIDLDTPVTGRYVRLYFNTLNTAAAGNGVGVTEIEIYGKEKTEETDTPDTSDDTNAYAIYPIPQSITYDNSDFKLKSSVTIVAESGIDEYTIAYLKEVLDTYDVSYTMADSADPATTNILLGVDGSDGVADSYVNSNITVSDTGLYEKPDAYMLDASENYIVIEGKDTDSVYCGVATLKMMFSSFAGKKFLDAHIEDYACVETRGYIEGFYGSWNFTQREDLMRFARDYKMNSYIYAAKGDAYHTSKWAELYPDDMIAEFENLVKVGKETKVTFGWSIHLGSFFSGLDLTNTTDYEARYAKLTAKLDQLYDIGVRKFDVLNDDFGGGDNATVVTVLNRLNKYLKDKGCEQMSYCPQGYNQAWSGDGSELAALQNLDSDINIYWTGADVNSPVTQETVNFLTEKTNHKPDYWLNYPVNEHASSGIFLGDITYYARDNVTGLAGFHSNPCRFAYANEVALYQLAALVWNNNNYSEHAQEIWESAFNYLQPEVKDSYLTIARNVSNAPNSSRVPGFNESEYLKEKLEIVQNVLENGGSVKESTEAQEVLAEFRNILAAIADFRENCANQNLVSELDPWLKSLSDLANAGIDALESMIALEEGNASSGWEKLSSAGKYYDSMYTYPTVEGVTTVAKAGSKRLAPFVATVINAAKNTLTPLLNPSDDTVSPVLYARIGGADKTVDTNTVKMYDSNEDTYVSWQIVQQQGDYYGLDLGRVITVTDISIIQGKTDDDHDIFHDAVLQCSVDKNTWTDIDATVDSTGTHITADGLDVKARYVRYYLNTTGYNGKPDYWTFVREFTVNKKVEEHDRIYTNVESLKQTPLTWEGTEVSVRDLNSLTLKSNEYVGIKLETPEMVTSISKDLSNAEGLALQYSYNGQDWNSSDDLQDQAAVKYLRLINNSGAPVQMNLNKIGMNIRYLKAEPTFLTSTVTNGISEGSYENLFDGDLSSYILTGSSQTQDTYITFDLGKMVEIHDLTAITTDGAERFYNAKIQISQDNGSWTDVAVVENDSSVFEVPYRYVRGNGNGAAARYLRIYFTGSNSNKLKLNEIVLNSGVEGATDADTIVSSISGNLNAVIDNDIVTLLAADVKAGDYLEYRISDNTNVSQVSVLQGEAGTGKLYAVNASGHKVLVGTLDQSVCVFDTTGIAPITAVRIEWEAEGTAAIHELSVSAGSDVSDDIGEYVDPIIISSGEKPIINLAPGKTVTVSGTSDGNKDNVNDGSTDTKWDSNFIEKGTNNVGQTAWLCIDLGGTFEISQVVVRYFNKIYPTSYILQISDNGTEWTDVKSLSNDDNGATYPVNTIDLDTPVIGRYVRLYFETLNTAAAGNGVGVTEFEIYGREATEVPVDPEPTEPDKSALAAKIQEAAAYEGKSDLYTETSYASFTKALADAKTVNDDENATESQIADALKALTDAVSGLEPKQVDPEPTEPDKSQLEVKIKEAENKVVDKDLYTEESYAAFEKALADAKNILENSQATEEEIAAAEDELSKALEGLTKKPTDPVEIKLPYEDVEKGRDWFYDYVYDVYVKELMTGLKETIFGPGENLARAQFAVILYRMEGTPTIEYTNKFPDVEKDVWYTNAILWAAENGIVTGYSDTGKFGPADYITREQMATMMYRYAKYKQLDTTKSNELDSFPDGKNVQEFAVDGMKWCTAEGIITGKVQEGKPNTLEPQGKTSRAECATIISRYTNLE